MLSLRPNCEICDKDLPPEAPDARICTFECTFCAGCAEHKLHGMCPNCGGNLVPRPIRPRSKLANNPPATERILKPFDASAHEQRLARLGSLPPAER